MRLRRTGKRGNKVRRRNTRKRQTLRRRTLRRKKRQSRGKLRGGFYPKYKDEELPSITENWSVKKWYDYIDYLKKYEERDLQKLLNKYDKILINLGMDGKQNMFTAFKKHGAITPST